MRILVVTNLFPPHHAGTYDFRCEGVVQRLRARGHEVRVLTSNHGLRAEQRGTDVERRLRLNGVFGHPRVTPITDVKEIEFHNNRALADTIHEFRPQLAYVWSLAGVSKSLLFTLSRHGLATAFDIGDRWLADELREDPWLGFWNRDSLPFTERALRASLELSAQRDKWDEQAPTRAARELKRMPFLFGAATPEPNSITVFGFDHIQFVCQSLRDATAQAGYAVAHGEVIHPFIDVGFLQSAKRRPSDSANRLLVYSSLRHGCGAMTVLRAVDALRAGNPSVTLTVAGQGDSDYIAKLRSFAAQRGLPVEFDMIKDTVAEMPATFAKHDILVHPMETSDTFTMTPVQAMAAGLPAVVTTYGTVGECFRHGENCIQFAPGDATDLANRIRELQTRPDLRQHLAERAQKEAAAAFEESHVMDRIEAFLKRAAGA